ncbi:hypothetical protein MBLNU459_g0254t1 [Dothideomycetes sp. NU459]
MEYKYSTVIDSSEYDKQGLCNGIDLRRHVAADLEDVGAFRVQEDWRRLVGPLEKPYRGGLGPVFSFITVAVPECLPDRLEITSYALEFGFIHDDVIDTDISDANLDEMEVALEQGGQTGKIEERKGASGKAKIAAQILREMMSIDPERAMTVAKSWAAGVQHSARRQDDTHWNTLEGYIPYRCLDVGYMLWHGLVTFGCAITIPEEEADEVRELLTPALISAALVNDLFSFEKERDDANVQNAVLVVMTEHSCSEEEARRIVRDRIRIENAKYVQVVKDTSIRTDISDDVKRYIEVMQYTLSGNVAWSSQCPRYNQGSKWNELQMLRAEYGVQKYPARWPPKDATTDTSVKTERKDSFINGNSNGHKRKREHASTDDKPRTNGTNGVKRPASDSQSSPDSLVLMDVVSLALDGNLPELSDIVVLQPYHYITSLPSKGFRDQAIDSLNTWLGVPSKSAELIKTIVKMLHSASLMLDDLEDGSPLRRGKPSTHNIYGNAQTINSATYQYAQATALAAELINPSYDLYWTHNVVCPSISAYLKMVDQKTGGLFRMLTRLMVAESPLTDKVSNQDLKMLTCLIGRFFQIRDDYQNLASVDYAKQKGFAEDLDEGKYSFTLIHCIETLESQPKYAGEAMQLRALLMKRSAEKKLSNEAKREVLAIMKQTKSLDYTLGVLRELLDELENEVGRLEVKFGKHNFQLRLMLEMLRV